MLQHLDVFIFLKNMNTDYLLFLEKKRGVHHVLTMLWSQCTWPLLRHTPLFAVNGGKHVSMGLELRNNRAQYRRFSPYNGFTKLLHLAYLLPRPDDETTLLPRTVTTC